MIEFFLFISSVITSAISGVVGMAGGVTLLALMTVVLPLSATIPIHGLNQLLSNSLRTFFLRKNLILNVFGFFSLGAPLGSLLAYFFIKKLPSENILLLIIVVFIFYMVFKPKNLPGVMLKPWQYSILGLVTGFLSILIGATGPLLAPFFLRDDYSKEQIISTKASCQMMTHLLKVPVFLSIGFNYFDYLSPIILMAVGTIIGTSLGVSALKKMSQSIFIILYKSVLVMVALKLLYKVLSSYNLV